MNRRGKAAIVAGASVLVLGAGVGVASAATGDSGSPSPSTTASAGPSKGRHPRQGHRGVLRRVEHGQLTLRGKEHRVVDVQRGEVRAVTSRSVTVKSRDGYTHTYAVNDDSRIRRNREQSSISQVAKGDEVWVVALHDGSTVLRMGDRAR